MIQAQSLLRVVDNSGGKLVKCIKVKNKGKGSPAKIGDIIVVSAQTLRRQYVKRAKRKINKSGVYKGVVLQAKSIHYNKSGFGLRLFANKIALVTPSLKPYGTRISVCVPKRLRGLKWTRLAAMARKII